MQRLSPFKYRELYPRLFGLWAGHLGFGPSVARHWLALQRVDSRNAAYSVYSEIVPVSFRFWWEAGLERNLIFSAQLEIRSQDFPPESEAIWVAHRLTHLFRLCAEPDLVMTHSPEILNFWLGIVKELLSTPSQELIE